MVRSGFRLILAIFVTITQTPVKADDSQPLDQARKKVLQMPDVTPSPSKAINKAFDKAKTTGNSRNSPSSETSLYSSDCKTWWPHLPEGAEQSPIFMKSTKDAAPDLIDSANRLLILSPTEEKPIVVEITDRAFFGVLGRFALDYRALRPGSVSPGIEGMLHALVLLAADAHAGKWMILTKNNTVRMVWMITRGQPEAKVVNAPGITCEERGCELMAPSADTERKKWNDVNSEAKRALIKKGLFSKVQRQSLIEMCDTLTAPSLAAHLSEYEKLLRISCGKGFAQRLSNPNEISSYCETIRKKIVPQFEAFDH